MSTSDTPTKEKAQEAASSAADEGRRVAGVAKEEAQNVAGEAAAQARNLVDEAKSQVSDQLGEQSRTQRDRLVGTLQTLSSDLDQMASANTQSGLAGDLVREVAQRARSFGSAIEGREPQELLDDVRRFARRRPGTFLLGALACGVVVGRVARGAKQGASDGGSSGPRPLAPTPTGTTAGSQAMPAAPTTPPAPVGDSLVTPAHGAPTVEPTLTTQDQGSSSGLGTDAAGYGQRGTTDEERPL
jgi:hypothetical protein